MPEPYTIALNGLMGNYLVRQGDRIVKSGLTREGAERYVDPTSRRPYEPPAPKPRQPRRDGRRR